jgi:hypothetical protein
VLTAWSPVAVTGVIACAALLAVLGLGAARDCLRRLRERRRLGEARWTRQDKAVLGGDLSMGAWERAGQVRQGDSR